MCVYSDQYSIIFADLLCLFSNLQFTFGDFRRFSFIRLLEYKCNSWCINAVLDRYRCIYYVCVCMHDVYA